MSRPISIKNDAILEAARKVFLKHGYRAGTAQVAREAGISEGSLFKHFRTKNDLFLAAMEAEEGSSSWQRRLKQSAGTGDLHVMLEATGREVLQHLQIVLPRMMMVRSSGVVFRGPHSNRASGVPGPIEKLRTLSDYFRAEVKCGRLVMHNPDVYAQIFLGTLVHYVIQEILFGFRAASPAVYVRTVVDMVVRATAPADRRQPRSPARRTKRLRNRASASAKRIEDLRS